MLGAQLRYPRHSSSLPLGGKTLTPLNATTCRGDSKQQRSPVYPSSRQFSTALRERFACRPAGRMTSVAKDFRSRFARRDFVTRTVIGQEAVARCNCVSASASALSCWGRLRVITGVGDRETIQRTIIMRQAVFGGAHERLMCPRVPL